MPAESLTTRLLASNAKIDQQKVRSASMNQDELKKFMQSSSKLKDLSLYIDDSSCYHQWSSEQEREELIGRSQMGYP